MHEVDRNKSMILFGVLILTVVGLSLVAYHFSGHMGIEDRFNNAVGIITEQEEEESAGIFGFNIEGNPLYYMIILAALVTLCLIVYIKEKK